VCARAVTETTMHASMSATDFIAALSPLPQSSLPTYRSVGELIAYHLIYRYAFITSGSRPRGFRARFAAGRNLPCRRAHLPRPWLRRHRDERHRARLADDESRAVSLLSEQGGDAVRDHELWSRAHGRRSHRPRVDHPRPGDPSSADDPA